MERVVAHVPGEPPIERTVVTGEPVQAIIGFANVYGAQMIVVGSRGRGALASAALGSVSAAVAGKAMCAVTIVRAAHEFAPAP